MYYLHFTEKKTDIRAVMQVTLGRSNTLENIVEISLSYTSIRNFLLKEDGFYRYLIIRTLMYRAIHACQELC